MINKNLNCLWNYLAAQDGGGWVEGVRVIPFPAA
jgi:hypothetical protein